MIVAIHQPESFPWLGFFHKMHHADVLVLLDTVQFEKNNVQNRNKILIGGQPQWITLPVSKSSVSSKVNDIFIDWNSVVVKKHLDTFKHNYSKHPYFPEVFPFLQKVYEKKPDKLSDFNTEVILFLKNKLGIKTKIIKASELSLSGESKGGTEVTLEICKLLDARSYLSGVGAKTYLDVSKFEKEGIKVVFQDFTHPVYEQRGSSNFIKSLSALDLYLNHGPNSLEIIIKNSKQYL